MRPFCVRTGSFCLPSEGQTEADYLVRAEGVVSSGGRGIRTHGDVAATMVSRASAVHGPPPLLPASSALGNGLLSKIIPRISATSRVGPHQAFGHCP